MDSKPGFDNAAFTKWLVDFEKAPIESGMPEPQAMKYRGKHYLVAVNHFIRGTSPGDAVVLELLG